jgi:hypothetical protein
MIGIGKGLCWLCPRQNAGNVASKARKRQSGCRIRAAPSSGKPCGLRPRFAPKDGPKTQGWKCSKLFSMQWRAEPVAQSVEHVTFNHGVAGSSPAGLTNKTNNLGEKIGALSSRKTGLGRPWEDIH